MVVVIDGAALLRDLAADFREFFLLLVLLLFFLLAGIGALGTSVVNFVDHPQRGSHHALEAGRICEEGSDFRHGYSGAEEIISARTLGTELIEEISDSRNDCVCAVMLEAKSTPHGIFCLTVLGLVSKS